MSTTLLPYPKLVGCVKCKLGAMKIVHYQSASQMYLSTNGVENIPVPEHLVWKCETCSYVIFTQTADAKLEG
jgi:hypothetical protein